jgi:hypothetical protein
VLSLAPAPLRWGVAMAVPPTTKNARVSAPSTQRNREPILTAYRCVELKRGAVAHRSEAWSVRRFQLCARLAIPAP